jgi:hypothetical protein
MSIGHRFILSVNQEDVLYIQTVEYAYANPEGAQGTFPLLEISYRLVKQFLTKYFNLVLVVFLFIMFCYFRFDRLRLGIQCRIYHCA